MRMKNQPKALILDDDPERVEYLRRVYPTAVWVKTSQECIKNLQYDWDIISLDHDLGGEVYVDPTRPDCGMEVVRWMAANRPEHLKNTQFVVHSLNADAAKKMIETLRASGYRCTYRPLIVID